MFFDLNKYKENLQSLNEVYFGKTKEVLYIEKCIRDLRAKYIGEMFSIDVHQDPLKYKLANAIEEAFGFGCVEIRFMSTGMINMATIPIGYQIDTISSRYLKVSRSGGYKFDKRGDFAAIFLIFTGLFFNEELTDSEITAVLLHEIGHNFTTAQDPINGVLQKIYLIYTLANIGMYDPQSMIISTAAQSSAGAKLQVWFDNLRNREIPVIGKIAGMIDLVFGIRNTIVYQILSIKKVLSTIVLGPIGNLLHTVFEMFIRNPSRAFYELTKGIWYLTGMGYSDEQFADSFATMYGYGPEMVSALKKMDKLGVIKNDIATDIIRNVPVLNNWYQLSAIPAYMVVTAFDPHPNSAARLMNCLDQLEADMDEPGTNPKLKKHLAKDIKVLREAVKDYKEYSIDYEKVVDDPDAVRKAWYSIMIGTFQGDVSRHIFSRSSGREVNNRFRNLLNKI